MICHTADGQIREIVVASEPGANGWKKRRTLISIKDGVEKVRKQRHRQYWR